jgi:proline iminopeptidase
LKKTLLLLFFLNLIVSTSGICQETGFTKTEGGLIHYKIYGKGYPILIINGGPGMNCEGFSSLAELLSDKYMAIIYDQRGTGKSELIKVDSSTITMDLMAQDIETLRQHLKIKDWIVLGHSFGGLPAQYYASKYPESIRGMILSSSGGIDLEVFDFVGANINIRLSQSEKDSMNYWNERIKNGDTTHYAKYQWGKALAPAYLYNKKFVPQIAERLTQGKPQITGLVYKDLYKIKYDCKETLKDFKKPVLIIQGRQDLVGDGTAYKAHLILKNSKLVFLNECVHYGWLEQREKYINEIEKFIKSID